MTILMVDDQLNVINGLLSGIRFRELGFDTVRTATSSRGALEIFSQEPVDILLADIEMPGENGLWLNRQIQERYPDTLRILLTSHADFEYAQESVRLGCFDYLVQPLPYEDIEAALRKAVHRLELDFQWRTLYSYARLCKSNEPDIIDHAVRNLFALPSQDISESLRFLNQVGYPIDFETDLHLFIVDIFPFHFASRIDFSEKSIRSRLYSALPKLCGHLSAHTLCTQNRFKQFVLLLFFDDNAIMDHPQERYQAFYEEMCSLFDTDSIACYVGALSHLENVRNDLKKLHLYIDNNIHQNPGVFFADAGSVPEELPASIHECLARWKALLYGGQKGMLEHEINAYLDRSTPLQQNNFRKICDLHQHLTQLLFSFFYDNQIDFATLFDNAYTYSDYINSFQSAAEFKKAVRFMLGAIGKAQRKDLPKSDVEKAKDFIVANLSRSVSVRAVAEHVNLSPEYFTKLFKKETGQNIKDFITQCKISAAKELLEQSNISVSMVALELGYDNFSHFSQIFKKYENLTPSEYRKKFPNHPSV